MSGVNAHITAAVCTRLLNGDLACRRTHRYKLFGNNFGVFYFFAVNCYGICIKVNFGVFKNFAVCAYRNRFNERYGFSAFQVLNHAAAHKAKRDDKIQRNQNMNDDSCYINPKAA